MGPAARRAPWVARPAAAPDAPGARSGQRGSWPSRWRSWALFSGRLDRPHRRAPGPRRRLSSRCRAFHADGGSTAACCSCSATRPARLDRSRRGSAPGAAQRRTNVPARRSGCAWASSSSISCWSGRPDAARAPAAAPRADAGRRDAARGLLARALWSIASASGLLSRWSSSVLLAAVLLTARAHGSGPLALAGVRCSRTCSCTTRRCGRSRAGARVRRCSSTPWRWSPALALAVLAAGGPRLVHRRGRSSRRAPGFSGLRVRRERPGVPAAAALAVLAVVASDRERGLPRRPGAAPGVRTWARPRSWPDRVVSGSPLHSAGGGILLAVANVHAVRVLAGAPLRARGLSDDHLVSLGLGGDAASGHGRAPGRAREKRGGRVVHGPAWPWPR